MKKITLLLMMLLTVTFGFSQELPINFDDPSDANFAPQGGNTFEVIMDGANSVGQTTSGASQFDSRVDLALETFIDMTTTNKTFTFEFYTSEAVVMTGLFQLNGEEAGGFPIEMQFTTDGNVGWETITLDFNNATNGFPNAGEPVVYGQYAGLSVFTNFGDTGSSTYWFDDIAGAANGDAVPGPDPTNPPSGPPTTPPNRNASDVVSIYSNAYTQAPTDGFEVFGGAVVDEIDFSGNTIRSVTTPDNGSGLQYQYFNTTPANLDLSAMSNMHIDFYFEGSPTAVGTVFIVIAQYSDGTNIQKNFDVTSLDPNVWHEMDVAFADFDGNPANARDEIQQVIVQVAGADGSVVGPFYFDNLYFHNTTLNNDSFSQAEFRAYPNPTQDVWNIRTSENIQKVEVYNITGRLVKEVNVNASEASINASELSSGIYLAKISNEFDQIRTIKLIKE